MSEKVFALKKDATERCVKLIWGSKKCQLRLINVQRKAIYIRVCLAYNRSLTDAAQIIASILGSKSKEKKVVELHCQHKSRKR